MGETENGIRDISEGVFKKKMHSVSQVMSHLVRGYFSLVQTCLCEVGQLSARCLGETDPSIQLHGAKVTPACVPSPSVRDFCALCSCFCNTDGDNLSFEN